MILAEGVGIGPFIELALSQRFPPAFRMNAAHATVARPDRLRFGDTPRSKNEIPKSEDSWKCESVNVGSILVLARPTFTLAR